jgi:NTE family protein
MATFDCVVLSGGGAKGAYSAGVCKALFEYRRLKGVDTQLCFIGTSAGALNACIIAALGEDKLLEFWRNKVNNQTILGVRITNAKSQFALKIVVHPLSAAFGKPFAIYPSATSCLRKLIDQVVPETPDAKNGAAKESLFTKLADKHVIFTATNYTTGRLHSFYNSSLFDKFVKEDAKLPIEKQRLSHCKIIGDQKQLTDCLLASSAVPVFFPPVQMDDGLYIDGGVGNNTPTREAAYFMRFLDQ